MEGCFDLCDLCGYVVEVKVDLGVGGRCGVYFDIV